MTKQRELDYAELKEAYNALQNENTILRRVSYYKEKQELQYQVEQLKTENEKLKRIDWHQKRKIRELTLLLLAKIDKMKVKK